VQKLNFFGGPALTTEAEARLELDQTDHEDDRIVFLANVWLDRGETFESLHTLLSGVQGHGVWLWGQKMGRGAVGRTL
jgi:hypothetical protein